MKTKGELLLVEVDGEGMLIDVANGTSFFLNETGLEIYKLLRDGKGVREITQKIVSEFDADTGEVERDVMEYEHLLREKRVL